jgi:hypothetical protein
LLVFLTAVPLVPLVAQGSVAAAVLAEELLGVVAAVPLVSLDSAGAVADGELLAAGVLAVSAEAIVVPPIKRRVAAAISPVFLKVIVVLLLGATWRALWWTPAGTFVNAFRDRQLRQSVMTSGQGTCSLGAENSAKPRFAARS